MEGWLGVLDSKELQAQSSEIDINSLIKIKTSWDHMPLGRPILFASWPSSTRGMVRLHASHDRSSLNKINLFGHVDMTQNILCNGANKDIDREWVRVRANYSIIDEPHECCFCINGPHVPTIVVTKGNLDEEGTESDEDAEKKKEDPCTLAIATTLEHQTRGMAQWLGAPSASSQPQARTPHGALFISLSISPQHIPPKS
ncbi:hypothetical protein VNO77_44603 [Canavalia gladiata]|uniref:Uncharacterized protein n=1 Tax=Canavalia gladiata TaxID=3824 RepID=A0AAN9PQH2_CANGL